MIRKKKKKEKESKIGAGGGAGRSPVQELLLLLLLLSISGVLTRVHLSGTLPPPPPTQCGATNYFISFAVPGTCKFVDNACDKIKDNKRMREIEIWRSGPFFFFFFVVVVVRGAAVITKNNKRQSMQTFKQIFAISFM